MQGDARKVAVKSRQRRDQNYSQEKYHDCSLPPAHFEPRGSRLVHLVVLLMVHVRVVGAISWRRRCRVHRFALSPPSRSVRSIAAVRRVSRIRGYFGIDLLANFGIASVAFALFLGRTLRFQGHQPPSLRRLSAHWQGDT